jgi:hypothetical protein
MVPGRIELANPVFPDMLDGPFGPNRQRKGAPNGLQIQARERGRHTRQPARPAHGRTELAGDTIPLGADRMLCVIETRFVDDDPVLVARLT